MSGTFVTLIFASKFSEIKMLFKVQLEYVIPLALVYRNLCLCRTLYVC